MPNSREEGAPSARAAADWSIRPAVLSERPALDALCLRSKAHWGYDADFMRAATALLAVPPAAIRAGRVLVGEAADGSLLCVAAWAPLPGRGRAEIGHLFVAPEAFGRGIGHSLFRAVVAQAAALGIRKLDIVADPHAAGFYDRLGARRVGMAESEIGHGRMLPLYAYDLPGSRRSSD